MSDDEYGGRQKPARKKRRSKEAEDDDDEFEGGGGRKLKGLAALSEEERLRIIGEIARYLVFAEGEKTTISRTDISKAVLSEQKLGAALTTLLPLAQKQLSELFGWEMVTVPSFTAKGKFNDSGRNNLQLRMSPDLEAFMAPIRQEMPTDPDRIFLMIVLSIIMMHSFTIDEEVLYLQLAKFGFNKDVKISQFQNKTPAELIKDLAKSHYIAIVKDKDAGGQVPLVNIGSRSLLEIGKVNILKFVNSICKTSVDPSALREFTTESESFIKEPASGEDAPRDRRAANNANNANNGTAAEAPNGNDQPNGHAMEVEDVVAAPPNGRPARRGRAKAAAAAEAEPQVVVDDDLPSPSQARTRRLRGQ